MLSGRVLPPAAVQEAALAHKKGPGGRKRSRQGEHFRTAEPVHPGTLSVDGNREWPAAMGIRVSYKLPPGVPPGLIDDASYLRRTSTALKRTGAASRVYFCDRVWILHHDNGTTTRPKSRSAAAAFFSLTLRIMLAQDLGHALVAGICGDVPIACCVRCGAYATTHARHLRRP